MSYLSAIVLVERHVVVSDEVVALFARRFGSLAVAPLQPGQHTLTDMDAAVVHDIGLHHAIAVGSHDLCKRPAQQVVADVSQVERFVGVGRRIFYHDEGRVGSSLLLAKLLVGVDVVEQSHPCLLGDDKVQKTFHNIVFGDVVAVLGQIGTYFLSGIFRFLFRHLEEWKDHQREVTLKVASCLLQLYHALRHLLPVQCLDGALHGVAYTVLDFHVMLKIGYCS